MEEVSECLDCNNCKNKPGALDTYLVGLFCLFILLESLLFKFATKPNQLALALEKKSLSDIFGILLAWLLLIGLLICLLISLFKYIRRNIIGHYEYWYLDDSGQQHRHLTYPTGRSWVVKAKRCGWFRKGHLYEEPGKLIFGYEYGVGFSVHAGLREFERQELQLDCSSRHMKLRLRNPSVSLIIYLIQHCGSWFSTDISGLVEEHRSLLPQREQLLGMELAWAETIAKGGPLGRSKYAQLMRLLQEDGLPAITGEELASLSSKEENPGIYAHKQHWLARIGEHLKQLSSSSAAAGQ